MTQPHLIQRVIEAIPGMDTASPALLPAKPSVLPSKDKRGTPQKRQLELQTSDWYVNLYLQLN